MLIFRCQIDLPLQFKSTGIRMRMISSYQGLKTHIQNELRSENSKVKQMWLWEVLKVTIETETIDFWTLSIMTIESYYGIVTFMWLCYAI